MVLVAFVVRSGPTCLAAADTESWEDALAWPEPPADATSASRRWLLALETMPALGALEQAVLAQVPGEPPPRAVLAQFRAMVKFRADALAAFSARPGERADFPAGISMGRGAPDAHTWRSLAQLKQLQTRLAWWDGERDHAAATAAELVQVGGIAARDAPDIRAWVTWLGIAQIATDNALWLIRQIDVEEAQLSAVSAALASAQGAWPEGAAQAVRGEFVHGFPAAIEQLPETDDIAAMLEALMIYGVPRVELPAADLGTSAKPLLDSRATRELYGRSLALFVSGILDDPIWRNGRFGVESDRRNDRLLAELGAFGEIAMSRESETFPTARMEAVKKVLTETDNPVGKLLVVMFTPNLDALAFNGIRAEAGRRCARVLAEWRRHVARSEPLPVTLAEWIAAGWTAKEIEDPFTGQSLFFDPEKLRVWSVGIDGVNNHGTGDPRENLDGSDFWWSLDAD